MSRITRGEISMRHKAYFAVGTCLGAATLGLLTLVSAYAYAIVFLWVRVSSAPGMAYGARDKLAIMTQSFPWWTVPMIAIGLAGTLYASRKIGRLYRIRTSILAVVIVILGVILGIMLLNTGKIVDPMHEQGARGVHERRIQ
ncbi:MAG: hypothetical protein WBK76_02190 [Candidatus Saccharimonadales bacterium]